MKFSVKTSNKKGKKLMAIFDCPKCNVKKIIHFGASGMSDFTKHRDPQRKERYLKRHQAREDWNNPLTAGALSRWILWNKPTLKASIEDFENRFKLKSKCLKELTKKCKK
tara:strand:+ start:8925 stop:9254 length:330 start_codon:yes stop_codon:yes gene_type:complete